MSQLRILANQLGGKFEIVALYRAHRQNRLVCDAAELRQECRQVHDLSLLWFSRPMTAVIWQPCSFPNMIACTHQLYSAFVVRDFYESDDLEQNVE